MPTVGSLFSGIGGLELGLERAGFKTAWQVETSPWCRQVLAKHWPDVARYEDVRYVGAHCLSPVDLICGGFPCQDISNAGRRAGIEGARSGLWREYARIVEELRPKAVLIENVSALRGRGLATVLADLAACGYDAEWDCIPAAALGAPHRRDRLFVVAYAQRLDVRDQSEPEPGRGRAPEPRDDGADWDVAYADRERKLQPEGPIQDERRRTGNGRGEVADPVREGQSIFSGGEARSELAGRRAPSGGGWWDLEPDVDRVANGISRRVDRLRGLGNAVVPQVAEFVGRRMLSELFNGGLP